MIAMTVGLILVGGMLSAVIASSSTSKTRDRATAVQFSGRYAVDEMKRDVQHAGYLGITSLFSPDVPVDIAVTNVCDAAVVGQISLRIWGSDTNPYSGSCIPAANYLGGDVIVVRRLSMAPVTTLAANTIYYHAAYEGGTPFLGTTAPDFSGTNRQTPYLDYKLEETVYYLSPYTTSPTESPKVPALYRLRLTSGPSMTPELVATGVEQLRIRYGVFDTSGNAYYLPAASVTDWDLVSSVEISMLVRSDAQEPGYTNSTTYTLAGEDTVVNDGYRRQVFTTVVQLRN
jgi:type IV pilus assembly protein PilW